MNKKGVGGRKWLIWKMLPHAIWWSQWLDRNHRIFRGIIEEQKKEKELICRRLIEWSSSYECVEDTDAVVEAWLDLFVD